MKTTNICESILCPFANSNVNGYGCKRYSVASHCHLLHSPYSNPHSWRLEDVNKLGIIHETQYFLYGNPEDIDFDKLKEQNEEWLSSPEIVEELEMEKRFLQ